MHPKPYLKKYGGAANFTVWIVDGKFIRTYIDEEFTNFGSHYRVPFIPKSESRIDEEHGAGEEGCSRKRWEKTLEASREIAHDMEPSSWEINRDGRGY